MTTSHYSLMRIDMKILKKLKSLTQSHIKRCFNLNEEAYGIIKNGLHKKVRPVQNV